jgi:hypothetical protein
MTLHCNTTAFQPSIFQPWSNAGLWRGTRRRGGAPVCAEFSYLGEHVAGRHGRAGSTSAPATCRALAIQLLQVLNR